MTPATSDRADRIRRSLLRLGYDAAHAIRRRFAPMEEDGACYGQLS